MDTLIGNGASEISPICLETDQPTRNPKPHSIWHNRDFVLLWSGQMVSVLGQKMIELAYPLLVLAITHSTAKAGLLPFLYLVPFIIFGLPAGALIDRWDRKRVMIYCDTLRVFALASVPVAFFYHWLTLPLIYAAALAEGIAFCFFNLAETSALPQVVRKEQIPTAMAVNESGYATTSTIGPALAGWIMALMQTPVLGAALTFVINSCTYMVSIIGLLFIKTDFQQQRIEHVKKSNIWQDIHEGLLFVWNEQRIRIIALWAGWLTLVYASFQLALIVLIHSVFHRGAGTIGLMLSIGGVGSLFGAYITPMLDKRFALGRLLISAVGLQSMVTIGFGLTHSLIVLGVMQFLMNAANPVWNIPQMTYRLHTTPDELQGRVNATFRLLIFAAFPIGSAIGGVLLEHVAPQTMMLGMAAGGFASIAVIWFTALRDAESGVKWV